MDIIFKGRHTEVLDRFRKHATGKLAKVEKLDHKAIRVDVEVTAEHNPRQSGRKERVELTITTRGPAIRAEAAAEDRFAALDLALAKLESRLRRACDRRKDRYATRPETADQSRADADLAAEPSGEPVSSGGPVSSGRSVPMSRLAPEDGLVAGGASPGLGNGGSAAAGSRAGQTAAEPGPGDAGESEAGGADEAAGEKIIAIEMQGDGPLVVREKVHVACPMTIDQALFEMELVGHDFFLFTDTAGGLPSVVYRRRGYQYGVIRLVEEAAAALAAHGPGLANGRPRQAANLATG